MAKSEKTQLPLLALIIFSCLTTLSFATTNSTTAASTFTYSILNSTTIAKPGCPSQCGDLIVPYPFGIGKDSGCAIDSGFEVNCSYAYDPPRAFMGSVQIYEISDNHMRVSNIVASKCYDKTGGLVGGNFIISDFTGSPFSYSDLNKFTVIGCDDSAIVTGDKSLEFTSGCFSFCSNPDNVIKGSCTGIGCCQTSLPKGLQYYHAALESANNHTNVWSFDPCSYAFLGEADRFEFGGASDLSDPTVWTRIQNTVPRVFDWAIGNSSSCAKVQNTEDYACKANSFCVDSGTGLGGYRCSCNSGFEGNPYLDPGCKDVDECADSSLNNCVICFNTVGNFSCLCPKGQDGDGRKDGKGCSSESTTLLKAAIGTGIGFLVVVIGGTWSDWGTGESKNPRKKFFQQNGGLLLKQKISSNEDSTNSSKIFTVEELEKATNNYADDRILGRGGCGTVYKGILPDKTIVAIKKLTTVMDKNQTEQFINEVFILTQINHRNVVRLLGCCLESEVPLLVYEFVSNGTLIEHIVHHGGTSWLSWENRLRIASEVANALSYYHSAANIPIIHRNVKSANIMLDEYYTAKISDFGASRLISLDQAEVTTLVQGTLGYLDPEYFHTSQLTEKSDVYCFGVVLIELLAGEKRIDMERTQKHWNLTTYFFMSMKENKLLQILEPRIVREGSVEQLQMIAELAKRCLHLNGEDRPTMKEVAIELEGLRKFDGQPWTRQTAGNEESAGLMNETGSAVLNSITINIDDESEGFSRKHSDASQTIFSHMNTPR